MFTHLQVKEAFSPLASQELKSQVVLEKGWASPPSSRVGGELGPIPGAHLDGVLPGVVLGQQLIPISVQLVDGLLLLLQLPVDEVLDGERRDIDPHAKGGDPGCSLGLSSSTRQSVVCSAATAAFTFPSLADVAKDVTPAKPALR